MMESFEEAFLAEGFDNGPDEGRYIPELRSLGDLSLKVSWEHRTVQRNGVSRSDPYGHELIIQIYRFLKEGLRQENPLEQIHRWLDAKRTFEVLVECGFPHKRFVKSVNKAIDEIDRLLHRALVRRILLGTDEEARKCLLALNGRPWPNWKAEWDEFEDEVMADIDAGKVRPRSGSPTADRQLKGGVGTAALRLSDAGDDLI